MHPRSGLDYGRFEALTFDCYGTLIDWEAGLADAFRADGRLREVDRWDVTALQMGKSCGQLGLERGDKLAACGDGRIGCERPAHQDDAGGECVSAEADRTGAALRT